MDAVVSHLECAVLQLSSGRTKEARDALREIQFEHLTQQRTVAHTAVWGPDGVGRGYKLPRSAAKRTTPSKAVVRAIFQRDNYTCRYRHCQRRTIALDVLKILSMAFPDLLPYQSNWKPVGNHILYWVYSTSLEHQLACAAGGTSEADNLLTSCYSCNDIKNYLPLELLDWSIAPPIAEEWSGLREHLPALRKAMRK